MEDYEVLREVLSYCTGALETAEAFLDAPTVMVLTQIIEIIEEGYANACTIGNDQGHGW